jgi:hypothetical protein
MQPASPYGYGYGNGYGYGAPQAPTPYGAPPPAPPAAGEAAVRLPLQIGTSSLWSLARGSATLLPGLAIVVGGLFVLVEVWTVACAILVLGGLLVWFAGMHLYLAARARPSDVLLDGRGLRIDGGVHHGRAIPWAHVDPARCALETQQVKRYTLLRIFGNFFAVLLSLLARGNRFFWIEPALIDIAKLSVGLRDGSKVVVAEAERPVEKESLEALFDAIRSSGWHETHAGQAASPAPVPAARGRNRHTAMGLQVLICMRCGGIAAPEDKPQVVCRYCQSPVAVPPDLQERIRAANQVAAGRGTSDRLVGKLLQQPGAKRTGTRLFAAAVPMMLAWPAALAAIAVEASANALGFGSAVELLLFPIAVILGLFFILRAKLADRFALRLLTLDFGAQRPARAGDPHTCRQCDAPLPERPGSVLVRCVYCGADNVLGLDLRRDAGKATREASSLEDALAKRTKERTLWGLLTVVAVLLVLLGGVFLVDGLYAMAGDDSHPTARRVPAAAPATPTAASRPASTPPRPPPPKPTPSPVKPAPRR